MLNERQLEHAAAITETGAICSPTRSTMTTTPRIALVTGATQGLGLALVEGLAQRMTTADTVYLTGRNRDRVTQAAEATPGDGARVRGETLDVADPQAADRLAAQLEERHGGINIVFSNAVMWVGPDDDPSAIVDAYAETRRTGRSRRGGTRSRTAAPAPAPGPASSTSHPRSAR
jgi:NAD(P)-dependent dehydrogenase (short-subunit alcohol dehydrogenase family)